MRARLSRLWNNRWLRWGLVLLLTVLLVYLALGDVPPQQVWNSLRGADTLLLLASLGAVAINLWAKTVRWAVMTNRSVHRLGFFTLLSALLIGQTINWFAPGRLGDLSRLMLAGRSGGSRSYLLGTLALEKTIDLLAYALLFLITILLLPMPDILANSGITLVIAASALALGVAVAAAWPRYFEAHLPALFTWLPKRWQAGLAPRLQQALSSLEVLRRGSDTLRLAVFTLLVWASAVWTNDLVLRSLGLGLPWKASVLVLVALQAGISVPAVPGRFGLFEYLCVLSLALFNVPEALGLSYGLLLHAVVLVPTSLASLAAFWWTGARWRNLPESEANGQIR